jgi:hypothetical protein
MVSAVGALFVACLRELRTAATGNDRSQIPTIDGARTPSNDRGVTPARHRSVVDAVHVADGRKRRVRRRRPGSLLLGDARDEDVSDIQDED